MERYVSREIKVVPVIPDGYGSHMLAPDEYELRAMNAEDREIIEKKIKYRRCSARRIREVDDYERHLHPNKRSDTVKIVLFPDPDDDFAGDRIFADRFHYGSVVQKRYV